MNKQKELAKNTIILTVGKICTQFVSFLLLPLYTSLLSTEEYGIVDLFNTYVLLLVPIFNWQFENGLFRFMLDIRDNEKEQKNLFSTVLNTNIVQCFIYLVIFFICKNYISSEYKIFLAFDVVLNILLNTLLQFPRGLGDNTKYAMGSFISASTTIVFNVLLIAVINMGAYGLFWATVIAKTVTILYLAIANKIWKYYSFTKWDRGIFKEVTKYSLPLVPNQLSWWVIGASDRTIVTYVLGVASNGIYSVANKFPSVFSTFYSIFNMSWTESVSIHLNDEDRDTFLSETINSMFMVFGCANIGIIACMPFIFPILIKKSFSEAYNQIPILMVGIMFQVIMGLFSVIYIALKKSVEIAKSTFVTAIINLASDIAMIKFLGIYAASLSTLLAFAIIAIYRYIHIQKYVQIKLYRRNVISLSCMYIFVLLCYYINNTIVNIIALILTVIYAFIKNINFIKTSFEMVKAKFVNKK